MVIHPQPGDWQILEIGECALQIAVGAVIDTDDFEMWIGLFANALQRSADFMGPVMDRDNDADQGVLLGFWHVCFALSEKGFRRKWSL